MKTLLYILLFNVSALCVAQDPQLFDTTWYLQLLTISGTEHIPPNTEIISYDETIFQENPSSMGTGYCDFFGMEIIFDTSANFYDVSSLVEIGGSCNLIENIIFNALYYNFFENSSGVFNNPFEYDVSTSGGSKFLLITNGIGDMALYGDEELSVQELNKKEFSIHPNPATNSLFVSSKTPSVTLKIKTYTLAGKLIGTQNVTMAKQASIDVSSLSSGIYFLHIEDENGRIETKKFIKQ